MGTSKGIPAIRSRCLAVRVAAPSHQDIVTAITVVAKKEGCSLPKELASRIAEKSGRNLRRAILMAEACKVAQYPFSVTQPIQDLDWEVYLKETANQIVKEQSPRQLAEVRTRLYELIAHCIPPEVIFVGIQTELSQIAAFYEHRLQKGNKAIYHLEAFVAKFMAMYMKFMEDTCGGF